MVTLDLARATVECTASTACRRTNTVVPYSRVGPRGGLGERSGGRHCRAGVGQRKDHRRNGFDGCAASGGASRRRRSRSGPDFIDPGYHALAAMRPGRNLDPVLVGEPLIGPLYRHGSAGADIAVVEGVMGLFDGRIEENTDRHRHGSTAHVAALLGAPVILVVDARGQSHSIAALLHGFSTFDQSGTHRGGHPQPGRLAPARGGAATGLRTRRCAGRRRDPARRRTVRPVPAPRAGHRRRTRRAGAGAVEAMTELVGRHVDVAGIAAAAASRVTTSRGIRPSPRPQPRTSRSHLLQVRRSASAIPNTPNFCAPQGLMSLSSTRWPTHCRHRPPRWCFPAVSPSSSAPNCRPTMLCVNRSTIWPPVARRYTRNAQG